MIRTRRTLLAAVTTALSATAIGCGGMAPPAAEAVGPSKSPASYQAAYGQPGQAAASPPSDGDGAGPAAERGGGEAEAAPRISSQPSAPPPPASPGGGQSGALADKAPRRIEKKSESVAPEPTDRPGLGTQWGETRSSRITTVPFVRADSSNPFAAVALFYNDAEGANAMAAQAGFKRTAPGSFTVASGAVQVGLRDEHGSFLSGFVAGDRNYAVGEAGRRYSIVLKNRSSVRFECVVSVDGLDVLDGKAAAFTKRGYLLDPHGEVEIDGFRQSTEAVAAFRFGSVRGSYANQKHGETRNVGVIGVALFHERGSDPFAWTQEELNRRHGADPFPGRFATPPN